MQTLTGTSFTAVFRALVAGLFEFVSAADARYKLLSLDCPATGTFIVGIDALEVNAWGRPRKCNERKENLMDWLTENWVSILIVAGLAWMMFGRGKGAGCCGSAGREQDSRKPGEAAGPAEPAGRQH